MLNLLDLNLRTTLTNTMPNNTLLTTRVIEFWNELKASYPEGVQLKAADELTGHFMEVSTELDLGAGFNPDDLADDDPYQD